MTKRQLTSFRENIIKKRPKNSKYRGLTQNYGGVLSMRRKSKGYKIYGRKVAPHRYAIYSKKIRR